MQIKIRMGWECFYKMFSQWRYVSWKCPCFDDSVSQGQHGISSEKEETRITWAALTRAHRAPLHPGSLSLSGVGISFHSLFPFKSIHSFNVFIVIF